MHHPLKTTVEDRLEHIASRLRQNKVINCLCPDGKRRVARLGQADTWFSISARVKAFGKTVTGFVTAKETETGERDYEFIPYSYRKNHTIFTKEQ